MDYWNLCGSCVPEAGCKPGVIRYILWQARIKVDADLIFRRSTGDTDTVMRSRHSTSLSSVLFILGAVSVSVATEPEPTQAEQPALTVPATSATVEKIMERAVQNIALRYNLNEGQKQLTGELMKTEVNKFLLEHEDEVWPVIRDLLASQLGGKPPENIDEVKRIGKAAKPLADLAEDAIFRANKEWRKILTDDQKKVHDFDMAEMEKTFRQIEENFGAWAEGKPKDAPIFPQPDIRQQPPRPTRPAEKSPREYQSIDVVWGIDTLFDTFVEEFIKDCRLDESQIDTARSILKEFKAKANDIKNAKKHESAKLDADQKKALDEHDRKTLKEIEAARKALLRPVYELFAQMEERLKGLLTSVQLERYALKNKDTERKRVRKPEPVTKAEPDSESEKSVPKKTVPSKTPVDAPEPEKTTPQEDSGES